jgi:hypothetical protein
MVVTWFLIVVIIYFLLYTVFFSFYGLFFFLENWELWSFCWLARKRFRFFLRQIVMVFLIFRILSRLYGAISRFLNFFILHVILNFLVDWKLFGAWIKANFYSILLSMYFLGQFCKAQLILSYPCQSYLFDAHYCVVLFMLFYYPSQRDSQNKILNFISNLEYFFTFLISFIYMCMSDLIS